MIVLGIDPGLATMGYGLIEYKSGNFRALDYGVITTPKEATLPERLRMLEESVECLIRRSNPDRIAIEEIFFSKNITTGIAVSEARGVILLTAAKLMNNEIYEYTPNEIKLAVTGSGYAEKKQMQKMVQMILKLSDIPKPDDAADALAVAITHAQSGVMAMNFKVR
ncbi:MAG: crossover junction endodeoxyribonuclease RuvC [Clostridiales bacterium]|nr:crossover junction endodeoxyribonuclease RuvC [Clostridiales bacterium]